MSKKNKNIVDRLLDLIKEADGKGVSRYRLAQLSGVSEGQLSRLVNKTVYPRMDTAERIINALGYDLTLTPRKDNT